MARDVAILTLTGDIYTKSHRTRGRFRRALVEDLQAGWSADGTDATVQRLDEGRLLVRSDDLDAVVSRAVTTFGIHRAEVARALGWSTLEDLADAVARLATERVLGRTFAIRTRRSGTHDWSSTDAGRVIGARLLDASAGVDLDDPEVEVTVVVLDERAWLVVDRVEGPGGLPLGTQEPCLSLLSGGFDSPVAAWMLMRKGSPVHFVHLELRCAQTEHALAVAHQLWSRWGAGTSPLVWVVDFAGVQEAIESDVEPSLRQVVLKQLMVRAADRVAEELGVIALVTGDAVGQVSSQTLRHLNEVDAESSRVVLRPLTGFDKQEIIAKARVVGTADLSARAQEVCDLSGGRPVAIAARPATIQRARAGLPDGLVDEALRRRSVVALEHWVPGAGSAPVLWDVPSDVSVVRDGERVPPSGKVAVTGRNGPSLATRLRAAGRDASVVAPTRDTTLAAG